MPNKTSPPSNILAGRRALDGIDEVEILSDIEWHNGVNKWILFCRLTINRHSSYLPDKTNWYIHIDKTYPLGDITFYPANDESISVTFQHQMNNKKKGEDVPWRKGNLCLETFTHRLNRKSYDIEPYSIDERLEWRVLRAIEWLELASESKLIKHGDPFELPHFPTNNFDILGFSEDNESFKIWSEIDNNYGFAELIQLNYNPDVFVLSEIFKIDGKSTLYVPKWGKLIETLDSQTIKSIWIKLNNIPVIKPWQAPVEWRELLEILSDRCIDLMEILKSVSPNLRDGKRHIALIGFPIPANIGEEPSFYSWQAFRLPELSFRDIKGFRKSSESLWKRDKCIVFHDNLEIDWIKTENWNEQKLFNRGRVNEIVKSKKVLQIGAGAVGSVIAELLVRSGIKNICIADFDTVEMGNLVRHTLDMKNIGESKVVSLVNRLNILQPHAEAEYILEQFPFNKLENERKLHDYDVIIDCSGSDELLHQFENHKFEREILFISISIGLEGNRLYVFSVYSNVIPGSAFINSAERWLKEDIESLKKPLYKIDTGCWHPLFPARIDDVWLLASLAIKVIENIIIKPVDLPTLSIYQQDRGEKNFNGVKLIHEEVLNEQ